MQINNLFARQTPFMMGNKIGGAKSNNVAAKAISNIQNMIPKQVDTTSADHIRKIYDLNKANSEETKEVETEETKTTSIKEEFQFGVVNTIDEQVQKNIYATYKESERQSDRMEQMYNYLTIAEKYEEYASTAGISQDAKDKAMAIVDNIKNYVATHMTTGDDVYQHMHKDDDKIYAQLEEDLYSGLVEEYKNMGGNDAIHGQQLEAFRDGAEITKELLADIGVDLTTQDIYSNNITNLGSNNGIPTDRDEFDSISTADMKELLLSAKAYYDDVANKVNNLYEEKYNSSIQLNNEYNPSSSEMANSLAESLMTFNGATFEGQMKNNLQSIELVLCTGENNSQQTVITKLVEIENVDVKLEDIGEDMRDYILQSQKDTEIAKEILGDYYVN